MNLEELSNTIVNARKFMNHDDLELFLHATEQIMENFKYENFKFLLLGFDDDTNDPTVMENLLEILEGKYLEENPTQYIQQLLMNYELMFPQAQEWLSMLLMGRLIWDSNFFNVYIEKLGLLERRNKDRLKNIYQTILKDKMERIKNPINKELVESSKKSIEKIKYILEVLDADINLLNL